MASTTSEPRTPYNGKCGFCESRHAAVAYGEHVQWRSCVRVAPWGRMILLGDTKSPDGPVLSYTHSEWNEFISRVKRGEYPSY